MNTSKAFLVICAAIAGYAISEGVHRAQDHSKEPQAGPEPVQRENEIVLSKEQEFLLALMVYDALVEECWVEARSDLLAERPHFTIQTSGGTAQFDLGWKEKDGVRFRYSVGGPVLGSLYFRLEKGAFSDVQFHPDILGTSFKGPRRMRWDLPAE